jgi:hypothetical protein
LSRTQAVASLCYSARRSHPAAGARAPLVDRRWICVTSLSASGAPSCVVTSSRSPRDRGCVDDLGRPLCCDHARAVGVQPGRASEVRHELVWQHRSRGEQRGRGDRHGPVAPALPDCQPTPAALSPICTGKLLGSRSDR